MSAQNTSIGEFNDPYSYTPYDGYYGVKYYATQDEVDNAYGKEFVSSGSSLLEKITDKLGLTDTKARYDNWLAERDRDYERQSVQSARAWDEYMQSTQYQRMVKDLEAAGLNPWLALQGGNLGTSHQTTASQGGTARTKASKSDSTKSVIAALLLAAAKLFA